MIDAAAQMSRPEGRSRLRRPALLGLTAAGAVLGGLSLLDRQPALVWNFTRSSPPGLYRIEQGAPEPGDLLVLRPSGVLADTLQAFQVMGRQRLLLKPLAGGEGDVACRHGSLVSVNGRYLAKARDASSKGRRLPSWRGCRKLGPGELLLISDHPDSFDGRYVGPIAGQTIVGIARPLAILPMPRRGDRR